VADLSLDKEVLKAVIQKTDGARSSTAGCRVCRDHVRHQPTKSLRAAGGMALELSLSTEAESRRRIARATHRTCSRATALWVSTA